MADREEDIIINWSNKMSEERWHQRRRSRKEFGSTGQCPMEYYVLQHGWMTKSEMSEKLKKCVITPNQIGERMRDKSDKWKTLEEIVYTGSRERNIVYKTKDPVPVTQSLQRQVDCLSFFKPIKSM